MTSNQQSGSMHQHAPENMQEPISPLLQAQQRMEEDRFAFFPDSLRGRFPEIWILALEPNNFRVIQAFLLILAYLTLFATIIGQPHRTEFISILMSVLAPLCFTLWYIKFPLNPYQTLFFARQGLASLDEKDDAAKQLVSTLSSPPAAALLWKQSLRLWLYFVIPMLVAVLALHQLPAIAADASWFVRIPLFFFLVFCLFRIEMFRWAIGVIKTNE